VRAHHPDDFIAPPGVEGHLPTLLVAGGIQGRWSDVAAVGTQVALTDEHSVSRRTLKGRSTLEDSGAQASPRLLKMDSRMSVRK